MKVNAGLPDRALVPARETRGIVPHDVSANNSRICGMDCPAVRRRRGKRQGSRGNAPEAAKFGQRWAFEESAAPFHARFGGKKRA